MAVLRLDPEAAAQSIAVRVKTIAQNVEWVRDVAARYDGLKAFEAELEKLGILNAVKRMCGDAPANKE